MLKRLITKSIVLLVTGIPGVQKLAILLFIGLFHSTSSLGKFVNDTFIIQILTFFSAINWANIIMVDLHKYNPRDQKKFYGRVVNNSIIYCIPLCLILIGLFYSQWIQDLFGSIVYLISFTLYQLWRHYLLTHYRYKEILFFDSLIILASFALTYVAIHTPQYLLAFLALPYFIPFLYVQITERIPLVIIPKFRNGFSVISHKRAVQNALSNFSTASVPLFIAPISFRFLSAEYTYIIGIFNNIANVMLMLPRAFALYKIPILSQIYHSRKDILPEFYLYEKYIYKVIAVFIGVSAIGYLGFVLLEKCHIIPDIDLPYIHTICSLILAATLLSQISLPISNLAVITQQEGNLLKANLIILLFFVVSFCVVYKIFSEGIYLILMYQSILIIQHFFRFWILRRKILGTIEKRNA